MKIEFDDELLLFVVMVIAAVAALALLLGGCKEVHRYNERMQEIKAKEKQ